jgi:hypothetical protein
MRDSDGDGLPDFWEVAAGLNPTNAAGNDGRDGDPDNDGMNNWLEYLADTRPLDSNSLLRITEVRPEGTGIRIGWQGGTGVAQFLDCARSVSDPPPAWSPVFTNPAPTPPATNVLAPLSGERQFYRIRAVRGP